MTNNLTAIKEEVSKINSLAMDATQSGIGIGFLDFSGHVKKIYVRIFPAGSKWVEVEGEAYPVAVFHREAYTDPDSNESLPQLCKLRYELEIFLAEREAKGEAA